MYGYASGAVAASTGVVVVTLVPVTTASAGTWVDNAGGTVDLHDPVADNDPATFIQSIANPVNETVKLALTPSGTPGPGTIYIDVDAEQV